MNTKALHKKNSLISLLSLLFAMNAAFSQTWIQPCVDDAFVRISGSCPVWQTSNFGTFPWVTLSHWTYGGSGCAGEGTYRGFYKFNLATSHTPQQMYDGRAILNLYTYPGLTHWWQAGATSNPYYINRVTSAWSESTITWNTQPTMTTTNNVSVPSSVNNSTANSINDVSVIVNDWMCGVGPNEGFGLQLINETLLYAMWNFATKEHTTAAIRPTLSLNYATINATAITTICDGDLIPSLSCSLSGAAAPASYTFQWQHLNSATTYSSQNVINPIYTTGLNTYVVTVTNPYCQTGYDTVRVYVNASPTSTQNPIVCAGNSYTLPNGSIVNTSGTYSDTLVSLNGCDSIITVNLIVSPPLTGNQNATICPGTTFTLPSGVIVNAAGTYYDTINGSGGCDSIVTTVLNVNPIVTTIQNQTICAGNSFLLPLGALVNTAGIYNDTLTSVHGCDSIITTNLTISQLLTGNQNATLCPGTTFTLPSGVIVNAAGNYSDTINGSGGCDSIVTTVLNVNPVVTTTQNQAICSGNSYTLPNGSIVNTSGTYSDTLGSVNGCDSIMITVLIVNPIVSTTLNQAICTGSSYILPDGMIVNTPGTYIDTLTSFTSCDSIITTILTSNSILSSTQNSSICSGNTYTLPGGILAAVTGTYIDTLATLSGCDSVVTTNLVVNPVATLINNVAICNGATYTLPGGGIVNTSGTYIDTLQTTHGCDSIISTFLTINSVSNLTQNINICSSGVYILPGGTTVSVAGTYIDTLSSINGCDSIITTHLTVAPNITTVQNVSLCSGSSYTLPNGIIVNTSGTYIDTLIASAACDSIIITNIVVVSSINITQNLRICTGATYTLPGGVIVNASGTYIDTLIALSGCDSIVTTMITVNPILMSTQNPIICGNNFFILPNGNSVNSAGTYIDTITNLNGCDSVIITNLIVNPNYSSSQDINICSDSSFVLPGGAIVNISGTYRDTLLSIKGCDSIIVTNLNITPNPVALFSVSPETSSIVENDKFIFTDNSLNGNAWYWDFGDSTNSTLQNPIHVYADTGNYCIKQVVINMPQGCKDSIERCVYLSADFVFYIPNAFTPDGDGLNDIFSGKGRGIKTYQMFLYNRWGEMIFYSDDLSNGWDGRANYGNDIAQQDIYVYVIYITDIKSKKHKYIGHISLVK